MEEYDMLQQKRIDKTITSAELKRLYVLAFGEEFMNSDDKGTLEEYEAMGETCRNGKLWDRCTCC